MRILILITITLSSCITRQEPIATLDLKSLEFNRHQLIPLDSAELQHMITRYIDSEWENYLEMLQDVYPRTYLLENAEYEMHKFINNYFERYDSYWLPFSIEEQTINLILTLSKTESSDWMDKGYEIQLFYPNRTDNQITPMEIGRYYHVLPIVEFEINSMNYFFKNGDILTKQFSHTCSDVIIDGKTSCFADTIRVNFQKLVTNNIEEIGRDTTRYQY